MYVLHTDFIKSGYAELRPDLPSHAVTVLQKLATGTEVSVHENSGHVMMSVPWGVQLITNSLKCPLSNLSLSKEA